MMKTWVLVSCYLVVGGFEMKVDSPSVSGRDAISIPVGLNVKRASSDGIVGVNAACVRQR